MKKFLTFALVCCLVFSSSSTVFATATQWDTSDQLNLKGIATTLGIGGNIYSLINNINSRMNTINNNIVDIKGYLVHGSSSIATLVYNIQTWMSPIYNAVLETPIDLKVLQGLLGYPTTTDGVITWTSYPRQLVDSLATYTGTQNSAGAKLNNHWALLSNWNGSYFIRKLNVDGSSQNESVNWYQGSPLGNIALILSRMNDSQAIGFTYLLEHYGDTQSSTNWSDLSTNTYTPLTFAQGLYHWLSEIQTPVARLSYVLASDERIEAQEAAATNEEAVVDNFIDSSGSGAASASDIGSVSDLSSGFKNNISTDASVSGIWNIFNANNFGWFSQETADQLDTSGLGNRTLRSSGSYPTPLLDQQTEDILKYIGGDNND